MRFVPSRVSLFNDVFDDVFKNSFFSSNNTGVMKADIKEKDGNYLLDIELPGYKKEDIKIALEDGYLTIQAERNVSNDEKDEEGNVIRRERSYGSCSRSFYVGEVFKLEDIKAKYDNGELKIALPKKEINKIETSKYIEIE